MICIGIDPAMQGTGIVVLRDNEVLQADLIKATGPDLGMRLSYVQDRLCLLDEQLDTPEEEPSSVAIEQPLLRGNGALERAALYGALLVTLNEMTSVIHVAPTQLKKFVLGRGQGEKDQMRVAVLKRWGFEHDSIDILEAYALARLCQCVRSGLRPRSGGPASPWTLVQLEVAEKLRDAAGTKTRGRKKAAS